MLHLRESEGATRTRRDASFSSDALAPRVVSRRSLARGSDTRRAPRRACGPRARAAEPGHSARRWSLPVSSVDVDDEAATRRRPLCGAHDGGVIVLAAWYERGGPATEVLEVGEMDAPE